MLVRVHWGIDGVFNLLYRVLSPFNLCGQPYTMVSHASGRHRAFGVSEVRGGEAGLFWNACGDTWKRRVGQPASARLAAWVSMKGL